MDMLAKFWESSEISLEPVCFAETPEGGMTGGTLLCEPVDGVKLVSHDGRTEYEEGRDYALEGKRIVLTPDTRIPVLERRYYCLPYDGAEEHDWLRLPGGEEYFDIFDSVYHWQCLASYTHASRWTDFTPRCGAANLPRTMKKLREGGELRLMFYGDSITAGWEASGCDEECIDVRTAKPFRLHRHRWPYLPAWPELVASALGRACLDTRIDKCNRGAGGSTNQWGIDHARELVGPFRPDLTVVAFGMNGATDPPERYRRDIETIMDLIRADSPDCEFLLVSPMIPNEEMIHYRVNTLGAMEEALESIAAMQKGVAAAPVHSVFEAVLRAGKSYYEITGNCINHPNDFSVRLYAQTILASLGL
ncbi:MAG: SGNH/GDSL hydrolase family protein [Oscillospiraceae bacterium]|nr:SGNH/GDSL hydrolase family protein [Oscillospiraceae bacterium]